jgi:DNA-binding NarL/FixJ family response regulator
VASPGAHLAGLSDGEVEWLRALAGGQSVDELAWTSGYSSRTMYRRLSVVYRRLGARQRTAALLKAADMGLLSG